MRDKLKQLPVAVLVAALAGSHPWLNPEMRCDLEQELGARMLGAARAEGHMGRLPEVAVAPAPDPLGLEALQAFDAGMTRAQIAFCLGETRDRVAYLLSSARAVLSCSDA